MRSAVSFLIFFCFSIRAGAQVRETIHVRILELEVAVLDRSGKAVEGLTRDDFEVRIANRPAAITNFYAILRGVMDEEEPATPITATASPAPRTTAMPLTLVIFVDDTRLTQHGKTRAIEALKEYVRNTVAAPTTAMLVRWNGSLDIRTRPSERPGPLLLELDAIASQPGQLNDGERRQLLRWIDEFLGSGDGVLAAQNDGKHRPRIDEGQLWQQMLSHAEREARQVDRTIAALREVVRLAAGCRIRRP